MPPLYSWCCPPQPRKAREVAVEGDPFAAPLDGERREPGVGDARAADVGVAAEAAEDGPVALAGLDDFAIRLVQKVIAEGECLRQGARLAERAVVGRDPNERAECQRRQSEPPIACDNGRQPR